MIKCAPRAGWTLVGFGVTISLLFAILLLALANSQGKLDQGPFKDLELPEDQVECYRVNIHREATTVSRPLPPAGDWCLC